MNNKKIQTLAGCYIQPSKTVPVPIEIWELIQKANKMAKELDMTLEEFLLKNMYINKK